MQDNGNPHPPSDWAIEHRRLELGVIVARTLFSDSHKEPVGHVCSYSNRPYTFRANGFLGLAKPVIHVPETGMKTVNSLSC